MRRKNKYVPLLLILTGIVFLIILIMQPIAVIKFRHYIAFLFPKGLIAREERNLLFVLQAIMLLVIIPVYVFTFIFSWRYNAQRRNAKYDPDLIDSNLAEFFWWGIPIVLTGIIAVLTWQKTHELDPYKPIASENKTMTIQVVALQWKWLFIYPEEKIATVNFLQFPEHVPVRFEITADAPMNSFWIPHLGGQIYAMPAMRTELNLIASDIGDYRGSSANLSGEGFAGMNFMTRVSSEKDYKAWVETVKKGPQGLGFEEYKKLALPSSDTPVATYQLKDDNLFNQIIMNYMHPQTK